MTEVHASAALTKAFSKPNLVKGVGYAIPGGENKPVTDHNEIFDRLGRAKDAMIRSTTEAVHRPAEVLKSFNPDFLGRYGAFLQAGPNMPGVGALMGQLNEIVTDLNSTLGKNFSLTSPLASGLVPFNLVAPSRLIYPMDTPLRNKLPRTQGQGTSLRAKLFTGIMGTQTGGSAGNPASIFIPEFPSGQSLSNWPLQLPPSGTQAADDLNLSYKFQGLSEALSWLAQFGGQGFEDISGLANLILLQEMMLGEEYAILAGTAFNLTAPVAPTVTARAAGTGEVALSGVTTDIYVRVTYVNYTGETVSAVASAAIAAGQVADVTINNPDDAMLGWNIYVGTGASDPGVAGSHLMVGQTTQAGVQSFGNQQSQSVGGIRFTLQGALPTTGATPPTTDTGTGQANSYEGILSVISGHAANHSVYPSGFQGAYVNRSVGATLSLSVINTALQQLFDGPGAFRANPAELVAEGSDVGRLSDDIVQNGGQTNYLLAINQGEVANVTGGAAVSQVVNPVTRDIVKILVHLWLLQGTAFLMSYTLPAAWTNVANVWEINNVQDYLSVSWPVIDPTFRYSLFLYGTAVCYAPQLNGVLGGLQRSATTPYS